MWMICEKNPLYTEVIQPWIQRSPVSSNCCSDNWHPHLFRSPMKNEDDGPVLKALNAWGRCAWHTVIMLIALANCCLSVCECCAKHLIYYPIWSSDPGSLSLSILSTLFSPTTQATHWLRMLAHHNYWVYCVWNPKTHLDLPLSSLPSGHILSFSTIIIISEPWSICPRNFCHAGLCSPLYLLTFFCLQSIST